ncbi:MAG: hypothetical protein ABH950_10155 [Candidatus Altiarchaeota archaeon]
MRKGCAIDFVDARRKPMVSSRLPYLVLNQLPVEHPERGRNI